MLDEKSTYQKILKATSIFGSLQIVTLISSVIRSKLLVMFIGTSGYGLFGMFNSTVDIIKSLTGFAIESSAVKIIAESKDGDFKNKAIIVVKISLITGMIGLFSTCLLSGIINNFVFENSTHWYLIALLGFAVFFKQLSGARFAILQGRSKLKILAKANLFSNVLSLMIIIPFFYFLKKDFIIPAIIIISLINYMVFSFCSNNLIKIGNSKLTTKGAFSEGKEIVRFGGVLVLMSFLPIIVNYLMQIVINKSGGLQMVGLYNVAILILNVYVGFLFSAMSTEYYPRLVSIENSKTELSEAVKQQATISVLLITPIILVFIGFGDFMIKTLFSKDFFQVMFLLKWALIGMFFKALSFSIGYIFIAKADSKIFTKTSVVFNVLYFFMMFMGYKLNGLEGIGIAIMVYFFIHLMSVYFIAKFRYELDFFSTSNVRMFLFLFTMLVIALFLSNVKSTFSLGLFLVLLVLNIVYTFVQLDKLVMIKDFFKRK